MMDWLLNPFLFLLGIQLSMLLMASVFRVIDLWYCIAGKLAGLVIRVLLALAFVLIIPFFLSPEARQVFIAGAFFYPAFNLVIYLLIRVLSTIDKRRKSLRIRSEMRNCFTEIEPGKSRLSE